MNVRMYMLFVVLGWTFPFGLSAQSKKSTSVGVSYLWASNINRKSDREFGDTRPAGVELYFHKHRTGEKDWERVFNYPHTGWSFVYLDHRNKILGHSFAVNRYLNYVFWRKEWMECYLKLAQGAMYASEIYTSGSNSEPRFNNAVAQRINFSEQIGLGVYFYVKKKLSINISSSITHFSNGAMSQPNDGLNIVALHVGANVVVGDRNFLSSQEWVPPKTSKRIRFNLQMGGGYKQITPNNEHKYPLLTTYLYLDKKLARASALNLGIDLFLNYAVKQRIQELVNYRGSDFKRVGISMGHELFIHRIGIVTQVGYHIYSPYPAISSFYQKAGLKYYFTDKLYASFTLRAFRFSISDEISWGLGLRL